MLVAMKLTILTANTDLVLAGRRSWTRASIRLRAGALAAPLASLGVRVKIIVANAVDARRRDGSLFDGDVFWLSQSVEDWHAAFNALRPPANRWWWMSATMSSAWLAPARDGRAARQPDAVTVSSQQRSTSRPPRSMGRCIRQADAVEGERYLPAPAAWTDRCNDLVRWQQTIGALTAALTSFAALAKERPTTSQVVTNPPASDPALARILAAADTRLSVTVLPWVAMATSQTRISTPRFRPRCRTRRFCAPASPIIACGKRFGPPLSDCHRPRQLPSPRPLRLPA